MKTLLSQKRGKNQKENEKSSWDQWNQKFNIKAYLSNAAKVVLRGKFIVINDYIKKHDISQINNLNIHLKELEKEETKPKDSRGEKITNARSRVKIN